MKRFKILSIVKVREKQNVYEVFLTFLFFISNSLAYMGEVQKVRFWSIFSKALNKDFLRMFIKSQGKFLIILDALQENGGITVSYV